MLNILKIFLSTYILILVPVYWNYYGPQNFLWLSDLGMFLTALGLWFNSNLLISIAAVGVIFVELIWSIDFFAHLLLNIKLINVSDYMFNNKYPIFLRAISLFHIFMPIVWILLLLNTGYIQNAIYYVTIIYWLDILLIYFFTNPKENINWIFLPQSYNLQKYKIVWLLLISILVPLLIFFPTHYIFTIFF